MYTLGNIVYQAPLHCNHDQNNQKYIYIIIALLHQNFIMNTLKKFLEHLCVLQGVRMPPFENQNTEQQEKILISHCLSNN